MKSRTLMWIAAITFFAALAIPLRLAARDSQDHKHKHHHYKLIDMGTFGGPNSSFPSLNRRGVVVGWSATSIPKLPQSDPNICGGIDGVGSFITVAFQWQNGTLTGLDALPGGSNCSMPFSLNAKGQSVGESENGEFDPLTSFNQSRAVLWEDGEIKDLGSFGGNQNTAFYVNNRGQIVGGSQNAIPDPFSCWGPSSTQCRAFLWQDGEMQDLGTLGTGNDADAGFINKRGQIAGISYTSSTPNPVTGIPPLDAYLWENGKMMDLGTFGGAYSFPNALNSRGQVIGGSSLAADPGACLGIGNTANCHPFLWSEGKLIDLNTTTIGGNPISALEINDAGEIIGAAAFPNAPYDAYLWRNGVATDLGRLDGDCFSEAWAINSKGQIAGNSLFCDGFFHHAFLWENGSIVDLNTLIPPGSSLQLVDIGPFSLSPAPGPINEHGEIAGTGVPPGVDPRDAQTKGHAFLLIPCDEDHPGVEGCDYNLVDAPAATRAIPTPTTQYPAVLTPASCIPVGAMNRFRLPWGQRNLGSRPAQEQQAAQTGTDNWGVDHLLNPAFRWGGSGNCIVGNGILDGYCVTNTPYGCFTKQNTTACPPGTKAKKPGKITCCLHGNCGQALVDLGSHC